MSTVQAISKTKKKDNPVVVAALCFVLVGAVAYIAKTVAQGMKAAQAGRPGGGIAAGNAAGAGDVAQAVSSSPAARAVAMPPPAAYVRQPIVHDPFTFALPARPEAPVIKSSSIAPGPPPARLPPANLLPPLTIAPALLLPPTAPLPGLNKRAARAVAATTPVPGFHGRDGATLPGPAPAPAPNAPEVSWLQTVRLTAVVGGGDGAADGAAVLEGVDNETRTVRVGDTVKNLRVVRINERAVLLRPAAALGGGQKWTLRLSGADNSANTATINKEKLLDASRPL